MGFEEVNSKLRPRLRVFHWVGYALAGLLVIHHLWALNHVVPIHDASNCVARASNTGVYLYQGRYAEFWEQVGGDRNEFLSFFYFSMMSFVFGPGRVAWGMGWALALLLSFFVVGKVARTAEKRDQYSWAWLFTVFAAPLLWRVGAMLDQRYDSFSVLLLVTALLCLFEARLFWAMLFSALAVLAKGVALPLAALMWLCALWAGIFSPRTLWSRFALNPKKHLAQLAFFGGLAFFYARYFLDSVISYNLMASKPSGVRGSAAILFIKSAWNQIKAGRGFYFEMFLRTHPMVLVLVAACLILLLYRIRKAKDQRALGFSLAFFVCSYLLFSAHPVRANVLVVWFVPAIWALAAALNLPQILKKFTSRRNFSPVLLLAAFGGLFYTNYGRSDFDMRPEVLPYWESIENESTLISSAVGTGGSKKVRVLANFLWGTMTSYNYDAFRVLLFERLGRSSPSLAGWEIGTYSADWRKELGMFPNDESLLFLLSTEGSVEVHHLKLARQMASEVVQAVNPACEIDLGSRPLLPIFGRMRAFLTDTSLQICR